MPDALAITVEEVLELQQDNARLRAALERIIDRAQRDELDLPNARSVPRTLAAGALLALQGLAEAALE